MSVNATEWIYLEIHKGKRKHRSVMCQFNSAYMFLAIAELVILAFIDKLSYVMLVVRS